MPTIKEDVGRLKQAMDKLMKIRNKLRAILNWLEKYNETPKNYQFIERLYDSAMDLQPKIKNLDTIVPILDRIEDFIEEEFIQNLSDEQRETLKSFLPSDS